MHLDNAIEYQSTLPKSDYSDWKGINVLPTTYVVHSIGHDPLCRAVQTSTKD